MCCRRRPGDQRGNGVATVHFGAAFPKVAFLVAVAHSPCTEIPSAFSTRKMGIFRQLRGDLSSIIVR